MPSQTPIPDPAPDPLLSESRRPALIGVLFGAMGAATLPMSAIGILATFIVDDVGITRATLGWIMATNVILAAALSPLAGRLTDHVGGRKAAALVFASAALAFVVFGTAPAVWVLFGASAIAAVAQATGNPATNLLIRTHLPPGRRGIATGIKQSGVQAAATGAGLILPSLAIALGWGGRHGTRCAATPARPRPRALDRAAIDTKGANRSG